VAVVFDASAAAAAALRVAIRLASGTGWPLSVLVPSAPSEKETAGREAAVGERLRGLPVPVEVHRVAMARAAGMAAAVAEIGAEVLVLPASGQGGADLISAVESCRCTVLLVRSEV
jgi:hypothetical protein